MKWTLALVIAIALVGCTDKIRVDSDPEGAQVFCNGIRAGLTPCVVEFSDDECQVVLRFEKDGYTTKAETIKPEISKIVYPVGLGLRMSTSKDWPATFHEQLSREAK